MAEKHNWVSDDLCLIEETTGVKLYGPVCTDIRFIAEQLNDANQTILRLEKENERLNHSVNCLQDRLDDYILVDKENEQLKQENRLLKGRIEEYIEQVNDSTKSRNDKEKNCGYCKNYNLDGMFGIWCSIHETPTSDKYCQDFEWNR